MNDWKQYPEQTTMQESARVVHERKALPDNELEDRCPRLSVHVHGQMIAERATGIDISRCKIKTCDLGTAIISLVLSGTGRGQNRQRWRTANSNGSLFRYDYGDRKWACAKKLGRRRIMH
jgi:hypothetical protein